MIYEIALQNIAAQKFQLNIDNKDCSFHLFQKGKKLYFDLYADSIPIVLSAVCLVNVPIIQKSQSVISGNFAFVRAYSEYVNTINLQSSEINYETINNEFLLIYYTNDEYIPILQNNFL